MSKCMGLFVLALLVCLIRPCRAGVELAGGPPRSFGDRKVTRVFKVDVKGPADVEWRTRILRGIVERGDAHLEAPGNVSIELKLPAVRARVELIQEVFVKQGGNVVASAEFPMDIFPEGLLAPPEAPAPVLGIVDETDKLPTLLEGAGWGVVRLATNAQYTQVTGKVVLVAPSHPLSAAEPMSGLAGFLEKGGTIIFLDQTDGLKNLYDREQQWALSTRGASMAKAVVKQDHLAFLDLTPRDLANWDGSGQVARRALAWDDWLWQRAWLSAPGPGNLPLLTEYWDGNGRVIRCQCEFADRLASEPAAQILLRNLIVLARTQPVPSTAAVKKFALRRPDDSRGVTFAFTQDPKPEDEKDSLAVISVVVPRDRDKLPDGDPVQMIAAGCPAVIQANFDEGAASFLNRLTGLLWPDVRADVLPQFKSQVVPAGELAPLDYRHPLVWGMTEERLTAAISGAVDLRAPASDGVRGFQALTEPAFVTEFKRGKVHLVFCALPVSDPQDKARQRIVNQIIANLASAAKKDQAGDVE